MITPPTLLEVVEPNRKVTKDWRIWFGLAFNVLNGVQYNSVAAYYSPTTGFNIVAPSNAGKVILTPTGALAAGTVVMPAQPTDGMEWRLSSTFAVTTLTLSPATGQTIKNAPTTLAAGVGIGYTYSAAASTWYRLY